MDIITLRSQSPFQLGRIGFGGRNTFARVLLSQMAASGLALPGRPSDAQNAVASKAWNVFERDSFLMLHPHILGDPNSPVFYKLRDLVRLKKRSLGLPPERFT